MDKYNQYRDSISILAQFFKVDIKDINFDWATGVMSYECFPSYLPHYMNKYSSEDFNALCQTYNLVGVILFTRDNTIKFSCELKDG
jgi:hypothetical protein